MAFREEIIGDCRLILGDCREVLPTLELVDAVAVTDPPYGISHSSNYGASWQGTRIANDDSTAIRDAVLDPFENVAAFGTWKSSALPRTKQVLVWDKGPAFGMGDLSFPWKPSFELIYIRGNILTGSRDQAVLRGHVQVSWEKHPNVSPDQRRRHPHQKPVSLCAALIEKLPSGLTVIDPFCGSGSTGVAAASLGMKFIGIEVSEPYFDIACERIRAAYRQPDFFVQPAEKPVQPALFEAGQ